MPMSIGLILPIYEVPFDTNALPGIAQLWREKNLLVVENGELAVERQREREARILKRTLYTEFYIVNTLGL